MRRNRKFNNRAQALAILFVIGFIVAVIKYLVENPILLIPIIAIPAITIIIILILRSQIKKEPETNKQSPKPIQIAKPQEPIKKTYETKPLLTTTERAFGNAIWKGLPPGYRLLPQICLASIIKKNYHNKFVNELFRIIDYVVFDEEYNPIVLIEINDPSHHERQRIARDYKVEELSKEVNLPIIKLWTDYGINEEYIKKRLQQYCK